MLAMKWIPLQQWWWRRSYSIDCTFLECQADGQGLLFSMCTSGIGSYKLANFSECLFAPSRLRSLPWTVVLQPTVSGEFSCFVSSIVSSNENSPSKSRSKSFKYTDSIDWSWIRNSNNIFRRFLLNCFAEWYSINWLNSSINAAGNFDSWFSFCECFDFFNFCCRIVLDWSSNNSQTYPGILETWLLPRFILVYQWLQSGMIVRMLFHVSAYGTFLMEKYREFNVVNWFLQPSLQLGLWSFAE